MTSEMPPGTPPGTPPGIQPGVDPKAAAKAAKAYAKATRPWYKKKRFIIPIGFVVLIALISALSGGDDGGAKKVAGSESSTKANTGKDTGSGDQGSDDQGSDDETFAVGDTVKLAGTKYTVTRVRTAATVGDNEFTQEEADGVFLIVDLTIENTKDETKTFDSSNATVLAGNGKSYSTDDDGTFAVIGDGGESLIFADMQPDLPKKGTLVFDLPKSAVKGSFLVVSDFWGSGDAKIDLGL
ncbi:MAG: DUF4352 domain-containing protein [Nocardioides sp.]|uniref:DUF4352 domain-containing protein n=1 Tax=Nocardioides sp. TaxID=35761 RepID=UPI0039E657B1